MFVCLLGLLAATPATAQSFEEGGPGPLPWRVGRKVGFTVDAAAFPDSAGPVLEVYVRVPPATITSLVIDEKGSARLRMSARLKSAYGAKQRSAQQEFEIVPADTGSGLGKVVLLRFPTTPGTQRLQVKLEDMKSQRRGLVYLTRRVFESESVEGEFELPLGRSGRDLSSLEFVWTEGAFDPASPFNRAGRTLLPNPERLYGQFAPELHAVFAARGRPGDLRPWRWSAQAHDAAGRLVGEREGQGPAGRTLDADVAMDLTGEPAGGYELRVEAWQEGDSSHLATRSKFSVAWHPASWLASPTDIEDLVHFLLTPEEEERFPLLHPGERERFLDEFWKRRDPTPATPQNEARDVFLERVRIANGMYGRAGIGQGMFSDMGRVFIRYGEPSEVLKQVIPTGDNTLLEVLRELSLTEDRPLGEVHQKGPGGDIRPFEVWIYEGVIPLPVEADPAVTGSHRRKRLVFLFVDEHGLGDYTLRYSTE